MTKKLLDHDPYTGITTWFEGGNAERGDYAFSWTYDKNIYMPEVEASKTLQNDPDHWKKGVKKNFVHYAHIPDAILHTWLMEGVDIDDPKELLKKVNSREYRHLKLVDKVHE